MDQLKRLMYISRFAEPLSAAEIQQIGRISKRNNGVDGITGVLVASGGVFFQVLEGPGERVDAAYKRIQRDPRHVDVMCLKAEPVNGTRLFPEWSMGTINVDEQREDLALPVRAMMQSLEHAYRVISKYVQPKVARLVMEGVDPLALPPQRAEKVILHAGLDELGAAGENLESEEIIMLLDTFTDVCARRVAAAGGELSKLTGNGLLAYFPAGAEDAAIEAALGVIDELRTTAEYEREGSPFRLLRCGIGVARGVVVEGNIGSSLKKEYTVFGEAVHTAAGLQGLTRKSGKALLLSAEVKSHAGQPWDFELEGTRTLSGRSRPLEVYSLSDEPRRLFPTEAERGQLAEELTQARRRLAGRSRDATWTDVRVAAPAAPPAGGEPPRVGRYLVVKEIGRGAMGRVFLGQDPNIGRQVAIKTLDLATEFDPDEAEQVRASFFREAEAAGKLSHPNIVVVHDAGEDDGLAFIAMEYLDGFDLTRYTKPDRLLPPAVALKICGRVAQALHYAHARSVIHRDVKPANIMILKDRAVKVTDFGIAKVASSTRTLAGTTLGSPAYMAPEQVAGKSVDHRADLFALGVTLYELLAGVRPFRGDSLEDLLQNIAIERHADVREHRPELPEAVSRLLDRVLAKRKEDRHPHGQAFLQDLLGALRALSAAGAG